MSPSDGLSLCICGSIISHILVYRSPYIGLSITIFRFIIHHIQGRKPQQMPANALLKQAKFLAYLDKGSNTLVELLCGMGCRELHSDACLTLRNHRIAEASNVDSLVQQQSGILLCQRSIVNHHGADGTLGRVNIETGSHHLVSKVVHVAYQAVVNAVILLQHLEYFEASTYNRWSQGVGEEVRATALTQHVDNLLAACSEPAEGTTERLTERTGIDVY